MADPRVTNPWSQGVFKASVVLFLIGVAFSAGGALTVVNLHVRDTGIHGDSAKILEELYRSRRLICSMLEQTNALADMPDITIPKIVTPDCPVVVQLLSNDD